MQENDVELMSEHGEVERGVDDNGIQPLRYRKNRPQQGSTPIKANAGLGVPNPGVAGRDEWANGVQRGALSQRRQASSKENGHTPHRCSFGSGASNESASSP